MVRRSTWILLVALLALVGVSLYLQRQKASHLAATVTPSAVLPVFPAAFGEPTALRIENDAGDAVAMERAADRKWVLKAPTQVEADQAAAEAAATQIGALRSLAPVTLPPAVVGLDNPAYTLTVTFGEAGTHRLRIGSVTPVQDGYYCQLDDGSLKVVDRNGLDVLIAMLKTPPYPPTPTPAASAAPTGTAPAVPESATASASATSAAP